MKSLFSALLIAVLLAGCASDRILSDAGDLFGSGRTEEGLAVLDKAATENPGNRIYRAEYFRRRDFAVAQWLGQADTLRLAQQFEPAEEVYRRVLKYDEANARAKGGLAQIAMDKRHLAVVAQAEKLVKEDKYLEARDLLAQVLSEDPVQREARRLQRVIEEKLTRPTVATLRLKSSVTKPISLELRDVPIRTVFDVLGRAANLNFLFDKDVRTDQRTTIVVRDAQVDDVIRLILATNQLEQKVLNETTALIYPNTPQKLREYQDLVVKTFYLANADVKQTANLIRTILKTRDIFVDEKLNMLVMKDTPNAVRLAEKLVAAQDLAEPEVMLEVEVLEVGVNRLLNLGLQYPTSVAWSLVGGGNTTTTTPPDTSGGGGSTTTTTGTPGVFSLTEWLNRNSDMVRITVSDPLFVLNLQKQDNDTNLLANPRIRVKNREKAKILIGERVPVLTTTAAATGGFVSQSVSYLDVGLKLQVEPTVYLDDDIGIKLGLEVSNITNTVTTSGGTITYQIGTRNTDTVLRLHDGETQILAGLISDEDRATANKVPCLGDMPVLGRLFSNHNTNNTRTEIVLLITPRLIRSLVRPDANVMEFAAGTEASAGGGPLGGVSIAPQPFVPAPAAFAPPQPAAPAAPATPIGAPGGAPIVPFGGVEPQ